MQLGIHVVLPLWRIPVWNIVMSGKKKAERPSVISVIGYFYFIRSTFRGKPNQTSGENRTHLGMLKA